MRTKRELKELQRPGQSSSSAPASRTCHYEKHCFTVNTNESDLNSPQRAQNEAYHVVPRLQPC